LTTKIERVDRLSPAAAPRLNPKQKRMIAEQYATGEKTIAELAADYKVGEATIWRVLNPEGKKK